MSENTTTPLTPDTPLGSRVHIEAWDGDHQVQITGTLAAIDHKADEEPEFTIVTRPMDNDMIKLYKGE